MRNELIIPCPGIRDEVLYEFFSNNKIKAKNDRRDILDLATESTPKSQFLLRPSQLSNYAWCNTLGGNHGAERKGERQRGQGSRVSSMSLLFLSRLLF